MLAFRRHETEWRVRPCGQSREDVQMAMEEPSVRFFFALLTFLIQPQKRLAVTLRLRLRLRLFPPKLGTSSFLTFSSSASDSAFPAACLAAASLTLSNISLTMIHNPSDSSEFNGLIFPRTRLSVSATVAFIFSISAPSPRRTASVTFCSTASFSSGVSGIYLSPTN